MSELIAQIERFEQARDDLREMVREAHAAAKDLRAAVAEARAAEQTNRAEVLKAAGERVEPILSGLLDEAVAKLQVATEQASVAIEKRFVHEMNTLWLDSQGNDVRNDIRHWTRAVSSWTENAPPPDPLGLPDLRKQRKPSAGT